MKYLLNILLIFLLISCVNDNKKTLTQDTLLFKQKAQVVDTGFVKNVKLDNIIVCSTTITDLKIIGFDPIIQDPKTIDSLILAVNWKKVNYYFDRTKNLILGTYVNSELVCALFLKGRFQGHLRDFYIKDFSKLTVHEITEYYTDLKWTTTGISDYWVYGNDTVNFYIRIDKSIPRFPLDEEFYQNKSPELAMIQYPCYKIYGNNYMANDTVIQKPMYAPFNDSHLNYFLLKRKPGIGTTIKEITSTGKRTVLEEILIGKWIDYNPDHTIKNIRYYDNGMIIKTEK